MPRELTQRDLTLPLERIISQALENFASRHSNDEGETLRRLIPRRKGTKDLPYLYRNFLEGRQTPKGEPGLFLHKFVASDEMGEIHNHPWRWSVSFILTGSYTEYRYRPSNADYRKTKKVRFHAPEVREYNPGDHNFIGLDDFHRVVLKGDYVWTLFLHGPRTETWGHAKEPKKPNARAVPFRIVRFRTLTARKKARHA